MEDLFEEKMAKDISENDNATARKYLHTWVQDLSGIHSQTTYELNASVFWSLSYVSKQRNV